MMAQNEKRKNKRLAMPVLGIGGAASTGDKVGEAMKLLADDVQAAVIPNATSSPRRLPMRCWRR